MAFDWAKKWLFSVFLKKAVKRGIQIVIAWLSAQELQKFGVELNQEALAAGVWTAIEAARQWLKVKSGWAWL